MFHNYSLVPLREIFVNRKNDLGIALVLKLVYNLLKFQIKISTFLLRF